VSVLSAPIAPTNENSVVAFSPPSTYTREAIGPRYGWKFATVWDGVAQSSHIGTGRYSVYASSPSRGASRRSGPSGRRSGQEPAGGIEIRRAHQDLARCRQPPTRLGEPTGRLPRVLSHDGRPQLRRSRRGPSWCADCFGQPGSDGAYRDTEEIVSSLDPARSLGPRSRLRRLHALWLYILAPSLGPRPAPLPTS
jgi:hypothetical protein